MKKDIHRQYLPWLILFLSLFCFRVVAQLIQKYINLPFLPSFEAWHSNTLPYPLLLAFQFSIIGLFGWLINRFWRANITPQRNVGKWLLVFGSVYFLVMLVRLFASFTFGVHNAWWGAKIPAFFHLVLASFILTVGHFHYRQSRKKTS